MNPLVSADAVDVALAKRTILRGVSVTVERGKSSRW